MGPEQQNKSLHFDNPDLSGSPQITQEGREGITASTGTVSLSIQAYPESMYSSLIQAL